MTFTWTLTATKAISGSVDGTVKHCSNPNYTEFYFATGNHEIYKWNGTTLTDLGFGTWATSTYGAGTYDPADLTYFKGNLYVAFNQGSPPSSGIGKIAKYDGSWSEVFSHGTLNFSISSSGEKRFDVLGADDNVICASLNSGFFNSLLYESTDGSSWSVAQISASDIIGFGYVIGKYKYTRRNVLAVNAVGGTPYTDFDVIQHNGVAWETLASAIGQRDLQGYLDGKSFFSVVKTGTTWELDYSTDYGTNVTTTSSPTTTGPPTSGSSTCDYYRVFDLGDDAQLMLIMDTNQVYAWNTSTNQFDADSVPDVSDIVYGLFRLNNELFAICENGSGSVRFYSGGALAPLAANVRFYFGQGTLQEKFTLPFTTVSPRAMTLNRSLGTVVIGGYDNSNPDIVYSDYPYPTGTATVTGFPTGVAISALKWI